MLVPCRNCGKDVGEVAPKCLHCGTPMPNCEINLRLNIVLVNGIIMGILFVINTVWFKNYSPEPLWLQILVILIAGTSVIILLWCAYKATADLFK
jgi:protein-S-isoprenylcysteine O-methyltransferase Ste14